LESAKARLLQYLSQEISDTRVLQAMQHVPRELFVLPECHHCAYDDIPLSIGFGQTISQPFIVALMTQALKLKEDDRVLEVGTGSGYQTAILAELAKYVISVERVAQLAESAIRVLENLEYNNVEIHLSGKVLGWPSGAPYDAIIVTAGSPRVPERLLKQLASGGRLVVPIGSRWEQELLQITKNKSGNVINKLGGCRFVPLIGEEAWDE